MSPWDNLRTVFAPSSNQHSQSLIGVMTGLWSKLISTNAIKSICRFTTAFKGLLKTRFSLCRPLMRILRSNFLVIAMTLCLALLHLLHLDLHLNSSSKTFRSRSSFYTWIKEHRCAALLHLNVMSRKHDADDGRRFLVDWISRAMKKFPHSGDPIPVDANDPLIAARALHLRLFAPEEQ